MTKEEAANLSDVLKAYSEGKTIQAKGKVSYTLNNWHDITNNEITVQTDAFDYRIKPEPKLRPYKNTEEFLKAQKEHGLYVIYTETKTHWLVDRITDNDVYINTCRYAFDTLLDSFTWQDGHPMGILE